MEHANDNRPMEEARKQKAEFSKIVAKYSEPLYWKIRRIVLNHEDANDILQNVFIKAWKGLDEFKQESKISTWLYRIAINESLDFLRKQKTLMSIEDNAPAVERLMADDFFDGDRMQAQLQVAIAQLPEVQRTVFNLRYFDEMKYSDISQLLGTSEGALKASYHIAVRKITAYLKEIELND